MLAPANWRSIAAPSPAPRPRQAASQGRVLLLLTNILPAGGAEVQSIQLALRLKQRGWDVQMASLLPVPCSVPALDEADIKLVSVDMAKGPKAAMSVGPLIQLIRDYRPDVLHCHMAQAILAARLTRPFTRVPVVIGTLHGLMMYSVSGHHQLWLERLHRATDRMGEVTTVVCQAGLNYYYNSKTTSPDRLRYVPNGVDTDEFHADPAKRTQLRAELALDSEFAWLCVGRFDPIKDHRTALKSFARMLQHVPQSQLLLAGGGTLEPELRNLAKTLNIDNKVQFLGRRSDMPSLLNAADGMLLTSTYEALPLVLLEAGACELPAVATRVGGNEEAVLEGKTGYLAEVADVEGIASAMARLAGTPPAALAQMGSVARRHVVRYYRFDTVMDQWEQLYRELLGQSGIHVPVSHAADQPVVNQRVVNQPVVNQRVTKPNF